MEWQPIKTAPKDGTEVLLFGTDERGRRSIAPGRWVMETRDEWETIVDTADEIRKVRIVKDISDWSGPTYPTHWMPLPPDPPEASGGS